MNVTVEPIAGALGAEIGGIDLREAEDPRVVAAIEAALLEHQVVFFRDQRLDPASLRALGERFGPLRGHPAYAHPDEPLVAVLDHSAERPSLIEKWHTDMTFLERPPLGSILYGVIMPEGCGDTVFSSMTAAWEGLSDRMRRYLDGMEAIHDFSWGFKESLATPGGRERLAQAVADNPPVRHPVARTHPITGRRSLFVNVLFTTGLVGVGEEEGQAVLRFLYEHATREEYTCRFRWRAGSVAFWDNRCTQHRPVNDHGLRRRLLHRVTVEGDRPR